MCMYVRTYVCVCMFVCVRACVSVCARAQKGYAFYLHNTGCPYRKLKVGTEPVMGHVLLLKKDTLRLYLK